VINCENESDAIFDVAWSENLEHLIAYSTGRGFVKLYDLKLGKVVKSIQD